MKNLLLNMEIPADADYAVVAYNSTTNKVTYKRSSESSTDTTPSFINIPDNEIWYTVTDGRSFDFGYGNYEGQGTIFDDEFMYMDCTETYENDLHKVVFNELSSITFTPIGCCYEWTNLTSITLPSKISQIRELSFSGCINLMSITYNGTIAEWNAIEKGDDWNNNVPSACLVHCSDGDISIN